jgi:hypothetical protein
LRNSVGCGEEEEERRRLGLGAEQVRSGCAPELTGEVRMDWSDSVNGPSSVNRP